VLSGLSTSQQVATAFDSKRGRMSAQILLSQFDDLWVAILLAGSSMLPRTKLLAV
jgi:hypothetical protein